MKNTSRKNRRISARLAPRAYEMIEEVAALTGQTLSSVLERSIETYHQTLVSDRKEPWKALQASGLIGSGTGDADLSASYKSHLTTSLGHKHDRREGGRKA